MKSVTLFGILLLSFLSIGLAGCDDEEQATYPLVISKTSFEVPLKGSYTIPISKGNGAYTLKVADPTIAEATLLVADMYDSSCGRISVEGKQKGETTLLVTDNVTKETATLTIKVTDSYLSSFITQSNHPALANNVWIYLINNEARDCYFLADNADEAPHAPTSMLLSKGTYNFSVENDTPYLSLTYVSDGNGKFFIGEVVPTEHKFDLSANEYRTFTALKSLLNVDWGTLPITETRMSVPQAIYLKMDEVGTQYEVKGVLGTTPIPDGILK